MGHDCDVEAGTPNPLAGCRNKHPPKPAKLGMAGNYTPYDLTRPPTPGMSNIDLNKQKWKIPMTMQVNAQN